MIAMKYLPLATIFFVYCFSGFDAKRSAFDADLVTHIDYEKYLKNNGQRFRRQANATVANGTDASYFDPSYYGYDGPICADPLNEVFQECGGKCVLGCRFASTTPDYTVSRKDCDKNDCVAGCFCKTGLVRHQSKCILATECPIRKCHRDEVYQCGPAAPITCDNIYRDVEIIEQTRHLDCVWGCYCPKGFLRNSYNGKCIAEGSCRSNKIIDVSPQIPGLFISRSAFKPQPTPVCSGPQCGCTGPNCGGACYGVTCSSCFGPHCYGTGTGGSYGGGWNPNGGWGNNGYLRPVSAYPQYPYSYPVSDSVNGTSGTKLVDEIAVDPVTSNHPRPAIDHYHHWEVANSDSPLAGNCVGSNVCNGAGSGVNNNLGGSEPTLNDDSEFVEYEESLNDDSTEDTDGDRADEDDSEDPNNETNSPPNNNENEPNPSDDKINDDSHNEPTIINAFPLNKPIAVIGAAAFPSNLPNYFAYPPNVRGGFDRESGPNVGLSTKKPNRKNQRPNTQVHVVNDSKKQLTDAFLQKIHQTNNYPSFPNVPNPFEQNKFQMNRLSGGQTPIVNGQFPTGQFPTGQFPTGQFPTGQFPNGQFPTGQFPNAQFPNAQLPIAQFPNGQFPSGQFPNGQLPNNNYRPNPFGQVQFPANQFPSNNFGPNQLNPNAQNSQFPNGPFNPFFGPHNFPQNFNAPNVPNFPPNFPPNFNYYQSFPPFGFQQNGQSMNSPSQSHPFNNNNPNYPHFGSPANSVTLNTKQLKLLTSVPQTEDDKNIEIKPIKDMKRLLNSNNCVGENVCNQPR